MTEAWALRAAAVAGFLAVSLGAFAAHGLKARLSAEMLAIFETGVRYHVYHTLALLAVALAGPSLWSGRWAGLACGAWALGILVFSGSLYLLALTGQRWLGAVTPLGGVAFLAGWACLLVAALRLPPES